MAYNNTITITGNLCADCEIYKDKVVKCRVAVNRGGNLDIPPLYLNVALFTDNDNVLNGCYNYLCKGSRVEVTGELSISTYEGSDGLEHTDVSIIASEIKTISGVYLSIRKPARSRKPAAQDEDKPARSRKPAAQDEDKPARSRKPAAQDEDKPARSRKSRGQEFDDDDGEIPF